MLSLDEIRSFFPESLHRFPRFMLREYLQYKILESLYATKHAQTLCFLGGTCLRIVHGNQRFSEDLDFDNLGLRENEFAGVTDTIRKQLTREGYGVELKQVKRGAWHCYIRFPGLLFAEELSPHQEEKILIQLDTEPQHFAYDPQRVILNKFEVFTTILTTPVSLLFAQKLVAILKRSRTRGRDLYDVVFLMGKGVEADYAYVYSKTGIADKQALKHAILDTCQSLDMDKLAREVEPFLFHAKDREKVRQFPAYFSQSF